MSEEWNLSDKIWSLREDGPSSVFLISDVKEFIKRLKASEIPFEWVSGGCDEEACRRVWYEFIDKLAGEKLIDSQEQDGGNHSLEPNVRKISAPACKNCEHPKYWHHYGRLFCNRFYKGDGKNCNCEKYEPEDLTPTQKLGRAIDFDREVNKEVMKKLKEGEG